MDGKLKASLQRQAVLQSQYVAPIGVQSPQAYTPMTPMTPMTPGGTPLSGSFREMSLKDKVRPTNALPAENVKSKAFKVFSLLEKQTEAITDREIFEKTSVDVSKNSPVYLELKKNFSSIVITEIPGTEFLKFSFSRKFEACNYDTLKDTIKHNGKHGINEEDLFPLYDQAKNDINRLIEENEAIKIEAMIFPNNPEYAVPEDLKRSLRELWVKFPSPSNPIELNAKLAKLGITPAKKEIIKRDPKQKQRKQRKITKRQNKHMEQPPV